MIPSGISEKFSMESRNDSQRKDGTGNFWVNFCERYWSNFKGNTWKNSKRTAEASPVGTLKVIPNETTGEILKAPLKQFH